MWNSLLLVTWSSELTAKNISRCTLREDLWPWKSHSNKNPNKQNWPTQHLKITSRLKTDVGVESIHQLVLTSHPSTGVRVSRGHALPLAAGCKSLNYPAGAVRTTLEQEGQLRSLSAYSSFVVTSGSVCSSSRQEWPCALVTREQGARARLFRRNSTAHSLPTGFSTDLASECPPHFTRLSQTCSVSLPLVLLTQPPGQSLGLDQHSCLLSLYQSPSCQSMAGKASHPADGASINFGHRCHLDPGYCQAALLSSPAQLATLSTIFLMQGYQTFCNDVLGAYSRQSWLLFVTHKAFKLSLPSSSLWFHFLSIYWAPTPAFTGSLPACFMKKAGPSEATPLTSLLQICISFFMHSHPFLPSTSFWQYRKCLPSR